MITSIKIEEFDSYINQYEVLQEYKETIKLYETDKLILLPRLFKNNFPDSRLNIIESKNIRSGVAFEFRRTLRPIQQECITELEKIYNNQNYMNGIIKIYPGGGKTVLALYIAKKFNLKMCVIVNADPLKSQWIEEIVNSTNLEPNNVGIIHKKFFDTNHPITIAMVQTLLSKYKKNFKDIFTKITNSNFDLVVYDEVHSTSASEKYSKISLLFPTKNIIGLSATPFHYGIQEILMKNTIGEIIFDKGEYELIPEYYFIYYKSGLDTFKYISIKTNKEIRLKDIIARIKDPNMKKAIYNKYILNSISYLEIIKKYTKNLLTNGYVTIILCERVDQVERIKSELNSIGIECGIKHGKVSDYDKNTTNVLIATTKSCGQAFNMPRISAIIIASPYSGKKSLFQIGGRSLRYGIDGKKSPIIIDLIDKDIPSIFINDIEKKKTKITDEYKGCKIIDYDEKG